MRIKKGNLEKNRAVGARLVIKTEELLTGVT
jgi:hypothetical protein